MALKFWTDHLIRSMVLTYKTNIENQEEEAYCIIGIRSSKASRQWTETGLPISLASSSCGLKTSSCKWNTNEKNVVKHILQGQRKPYFTAMSQYVLLLYHVQIAVTKSQGRNKNFFNLMVIQWGFHNVVYIPSLSKPSPNNVGISYMNYVSSFQSILGKILQ